MRACFAGLLLSIGLVGANVLKPEHRPRVFVLSDVANEPDDAQSLVRLLTYSNLLDLEGIVATTSTWLRGSTHEEQFHIVYDGYEEVLSNLQVHAEPGTRYPSVEHLKSITASADPVFGLEALNLPLSPGSSHLVDAISRSDPHSRPLHVQLWGGGSSLAQALQHLRSTRSASDLVELLARIRVYSISDQDDAGPWIRREFPMIHYVVSLHGENQYASAAWSGISGDAFYGIVGGDRSTCSMDWLKQHIQIGPLGAKYPDLAFIMEGDSPAFLGVLPNGLNIPSDISAGGWGGRYRKTLDSFSQHFHDAVDQVRSPVDGEIKISSQATIWRWRQDFQSDFAARMQWTLNGDFSAANHPPFVVVDGDDSWEPIRISIAEGETCEFDASGSSDPDGDELEYLWYQYKDVTSHQSMVDAEVPTLETYGTSTSPRLRVTAPKDISFVHFPFLYTESRDFHIILQVRDNGTPALTRYRRVILTVFKAAKTAAILHEEL